MDRWLNSHWFARGVALLLATMLWMVVNLEPDVGSSADTVRPMFIDGVNVEVVDYDADRYEVVRQSPKQVKVALESDNPFFRYRFLSPDQYKVYVDAKGLGKGTHRLPVQHRGFPEDARVEITPSVIEVTLEEKQTLEREVQVELLGQVAPGYTAGEPIVKPFRVHVRVPESQVDDVAAVKASVNLDDATEAIQTTAQLKVVDKSGNVIPRAEVNPLTVEVTVPVTSPFVTVPVKLNLTNDLPDGYSLASVDMNVDEATVYGPREVVDEIRKAGTYPGPEIDLSQLTADRVLELKMPILDQVVKVDPEYLRVSLKVVRSETKLLENVPLRVSGLSPNRQAKVLGPDGKEMTTVDFYVIGAAENLRDLGPDDVQVVADISSLPLGVHEVPLVYNLPNFVKTSTSALRQVTVEITEKTM